MSARLLEGKIALITGAAQGLGKAAAVALAEKGAHVVVTDVYSERGAETARSLRSEGHGAEFFALDVAKEDQWVSTISAVAASLGKIDILVNNAALIEVAPIEEMSVEQFDKVISVNVRGVFLGCKHVLPAMKAAHGGSIINVASIVAMAATSDGQAAYATSKGAVRSLTKAVARDYVGHNIRVNSVHPGAMRTPAVDLLLKNPVQAPAVLGRTPMKRISDPSEVAAVIAFLASDDSSYMTGSEIVVDGGWLAV